MSDGNALVTKEQAQAIISVEELKHQTEQLNELYRGLMQEGTDYGKVPGTDKPTLLKSGAELLRLRARLAPQFTVDNTGTDLKGGVFNYEVACELYRDGDYIGGGVGSCNSLESKYRYRWVFESQLPKGIDKDTLPSKKFQKNNRWYVTYRVENDNPQDLANTILKMAKKRAFVDAILTVTGASRIFTQDVEDLTENVITEEPAQPTKQTKAKDSEEEPEPTEPKHEPSTPTGKKVQNIAELKSLLMKYKIGTAEAYEILSISAFTELKDLDEAWAKVKEAKGIES